MLIIVKDSEYIKIKFSRDLPLQTEIFKWISHGIF
jgi:hypothetical protein